MHAADLGGRDPQDPSTPERERGDGHQRERPDGRGERDVTAARVGAAVRELGRGRRQQGRRGDRQIERKGGGRQQDVPGAGDPEMPDLHHDHGREHGAERQVEREQA